MADNDHNEEENELNEAVEQVQVDEGDSEEQQNQQATTTSTVATGIDSLDAQLAEENLDAASGAGGGATVSEESAGGEDLSGGTTTVPTDSTVSASQSVDGGTGDSQEGTDDSASAIPTSTDEVGAQSIGGEDTTTDSSSGNSGNTPAVNNAATNSAVGGADTAVEDGIDTETNSETFDVNVEASGTADIPGEGGDINFDTETTSSTFQINVDAVNDAAEVSGPIDLDMQEDGTILITQDQLLATATDIDGDTLTAQNLSLTNESLGSLTDNGDGTFSFTPSEDFHGDIGFNYDVFDGTERGGTKNSDRVLSSIL